MKNTLKIVAVTALAGAATLGTGSAAAWWGNDYYDDYYGPWGGGPWYGYPGYGYGYPGYGYGYRGYGWTQTSVNAIPTTPPGCFETPCRARPKPPFP